MTTTLLNAIEELKGNNKLNTTVIDDILEDAKEYDGTEEEQIISRLKEILEHGCVSGTVSSMVYYSDTLKFYEEYKVEINELLFESMSDSGMYSPSEIFGDGFDKEDPLFIEQTNQNLIAWFGYEEIARKLMYSVNPEY